MNFYVQARAYSNEETWKYAYITSDIINDVIDFLMKYSDRNVSIEIFVDQKRRFWLSKEGSIDGKSALVLFKYWVGELIGINEMEIIFIVSDTALFFGVKQNKLLTSDYKKVIDFMREETRKHKKVTLEIYLDGTRVYCLPPAGLIPEEAEVMLNHWMKKIKETKGEIDEQFTS